MKPNETKIPFLWPTVVCLIIWMLVAFCMTSCTPAFTMPGFSVEGNFADYNYSAKDNRWTIRPRTSIIKIRNEK